MTSNRLKYMQAKWAYIWLGMRGYRHNYSRRQTLKMFLVS